jgi:hypothetical protein
MKIILSRKGFDSASGGCPSFIIGNKLVSLPIPDEHTKLKYNDVKICGYNLGEIFKDSKIKPKLNGKEIMTCHLDPDIESGLFGQCSTAAQHLINNNVKVGDLLLFFGWFREFDIKTHKFSMQDKNGKHCIYAYFKIGRILYLNNSKDKKEALQLTKTHPHITYESTEYEKTNLLFVADTKLLENSNIKGCGRLKFSESTTLTKSNGNKSIWQLPKCFMNVNMTYHTNKNRWIGLNEEFCQLKSVCRGQEFVISESNDVEQWAIRLIKENLL